ncbi:mitochondrial acyl carrier protein [Naganishia albida]|nr:mitochondrial acyl carrier protein [Naganishia albida]
MFRAAIPAFRAVARSSVIAARPVAQTQRIAGQRWYAASAALDKEQITSRVLEVLKGFEKVDGGKLTPTATFTKDLGLDSLDAVEVVMAIEEEFAVEIPDEEADQITSVGQAIEYIAKTPEAH